MTNELKVLITPRRAALAGGQSNTVDLLVRVQAPEKPAGIAERPRPDLNIALVIDRSGSMEGAPLAEARKAAQFVVDHLGRRDRCALVVYDNRADLLVPALHLEDKERFHSAIRRIRSGGSTDLHQGWVMGAEALAPFTAATAISRVILLSDGNANAGLTDNAAIAAQVARLAAAGVTTSTLGLGRDFNEALMTGIATAGQGRAYYGDTAEDLMAPFREEFDLLGAIAGRKVACLLKPVRGVDVEVLNRYQRDAQGRIVLPDVAWGSEATISVRLTVPSGITAGADVVELLSASVAYLDLDGAAHGVASDPVVLPVMDSAAHARLAENEQVARRFGEIDASQLQEMARDAALRGDWQVVEQLLERIRAIAANNAWVEGVLREIEALAQQRDSARFAKEAMYASHSMRTRLSAPNEAAELNCEPQAASYLARKLRHGKGSDRS